MPFPKHNAVSLMPFPLISAVAQNRICDEMCTPDGCWGPGPTMCFSCMNHSRKKSCVASCNLLEG